MNSRYNLEVNKLVDLESVDSRIFTSDNRATQASCDFVLALALVFNDLKDVLLAFSLLITTAPTDLQTHTKELGAFAGGHLHLYRLLVAVLHELLAVVRKNDAVRASSSFADVVNTLRERPRSAWQKIVAAAEVNSSADPDVKFLLVARNTVAFHYDRKALGQGYRIAFPQTSQDLPLLSPGTSIEGTRFYFADRAAQAYLQETFGDPDLHQYFLRQPEFVPDIGLALFKIVTAFISSRSVALRTAVG